MDAPAVLRQAARKATRLLPFDAVAGTLSGLSATAEKQTGPDDPTTAVSREMVALGANLAGAGLAAAGRLSRVSRLPVVVPALASATANVPQLRAVIRAKLGPDRVEPLLAAGEAALTVLSGQPGGMLVDALHRVQRLSEARARQGAWARRARELFTPDGPEQEDTAVSAGRPRPLPDGPVERYAARAAAAAGAGWAGGLLAVRPHLSAAALAAGSAKPARLAKESFAARIGRSVAEHDIVVDDPRALRRLDQVDTVVLEAGLLVTGRWSIDEVVPLDGDADAPGLHARALGLLDPADPAAQQERDGWRIGPTTGPERGAADWPAGAKLATLSKGNRPVAVVSLLPELDPYAEALVAAAAGVGDVLVAGVGSRLDRRLAVTGTVPAGGKLGESVRRLQADGRGVVLVAQHGRPALAAADIGIAVAGPDSGTRARRGTGHLFCGPGLSHAVQLLAAVPAARQAAADGTRIAAYEAAAATVIGLASPPSRAGHHALLGSNFAALAGIAAGLWRADPVARMHPPRPVDRNPWHAIPVREVLDRLRSSLRGLAGEEAAHRRPAAGDAQPQPSGLGRAVAEELANPLTPALAAGAGLAAAVGSTLDAALIGGVVAVNSLVGSAQRLGADRAVRRLAAHTSLPVRLLRDGEPVTASTDEIVPGDIVELRAGDAVPADLRIVEAVGLEADEANLTGESMPVAKNARASTARVPADRTSMLYEGTAVAAGHALAAVVATGPDTEASRAEQSAETPRPSGVQGHLQELTRSVLPLSAGAGVLLLATNLLRGLPMGRALNPAVSLAVASVPEGLPSVATVAQLSAARRLSRRGVLVRNPSTLESLGRVQALCFDKTGTLTEGRLRLRLVSDGTEEAAPGELPDRLRRVLVAAVRATPGQGSGGALAHPTDRAVAAGGQEAGITVEDGLSGWEREDELPFEPSRGLHATLGGAGD